MLSLNDKIEKYKKVGQRYIKKLHKLGIYTIYDLLFYFPHRYEDFSDIIPIAKVGLNQKVTILGEIVEIINRKTFKKRMNITEAIIRDKSGSIRAIWFNQPYLIRTLKKKKHIAVSGKTTLSEYGLTLSNPYYELLPNYEFSSDNYASSLVSKLKHTARLVPIYHETYGLSSRYLRYLIYPIIPLADKIPDFLPSEIKKEYNLMDLPFAIKEIHFPKSLDSMKKARTRLSFDELFLINLNVLKQKYELLKEKSFSIPFNQNLIKNFVEKLPFKLTDSQKIAAWEIFQDMQKTKPMNRLLNGDVGSGKTMVAILASLLVCKTGYQTAFMTPTEVLAKQHFLTLKKFLKGQNLNIGLITGSTQKLIGKKTFQIMQISKERFKKMVNEGKIDLVVGTHTLIQDNLSFPKLALVIVDEQHRFGVEQRAKLIIGNIEKQTNDKLKRINKEAKRTIPHLLSMSATPIPRTLALTVYGDLDISILKEIPTGKRKVITKIIPPEKRSYAYNLIRKQAKLKKQAFVICPRIETKDEKSGTRKKTGWEDVKAVKEEYEKLKDEFPEFKIAMLHGKMKPKEKEKIMKDFSLNKINILVSTSVIEVGIDIPNATVIVIESAERFGLAQLHQFRGRVGRNKYKSYCLLFTNSSSSKTYKRLEALLISKNGFELAEKDLQIRGPGELTGKRQWGIPDLTMASLNDLELIQKTKEAAKKTIEQNLWNPVLVEKMKSFEKKIHLE